MRVAHLAHSKRDTSVSQSNQKPEPVPGFSSNCNLGNVRKKETDLNFIVTSLRNKAFKFCDLVESNAHSILYFITV